MFTKERCMTWMKKIWNAFLRDAVPVVLDKKGKKYLTEKDDKWSKKKK